MLVKFLGQRYSEKNSKFKIKNSKLGLDVENRLNENLSSVAAGVAHIVRYATEDTR